MKQLVRLGRDYVNGVSVHSKHQDIALAWVKFFAETDYSTRLASSVSPWLAVSSRRSLWIGTIWA